MEMGVKYLHQNLTEDHLFLNYLLGKKCKMEEDQNEVKVRILKTKILQNST